MNRELNNGIYQKIEHLSDPTQPQYMVISCVQNGDINVTYLDKDKNIIHYLYIINIGHQNIGVSTPHSPGNSSNDYSFTVGTTADSSFAFTGVTHGISALYGEYYSTHTNFNIFGKCYYSQVFIFKNGSISPSQYIKIDQFP